MEESAERARTVRFQLGASCLEMATRSPAKHLRPYVRDFCGYMEQAAGVLRRREFPGPQVVVIFEFGPPIRIYEYGTERESSRYPGGFVAGLCDASTLTEHDGFQRGLQLNLTPIGARLFFGVPMSELAGRVVSVRDLLPKKHRDVAEQLEALPDWDARFDLIERLLDERIAQARVQTSVVSWAFRRIEECGGAVDIRALVRELGYSQRHVIGLFRDHVGLPPKLLARIVRFDRLMKHLRAGTSETWAQLALEFGYYDQSHLVRDVRQFTGMTPTKARGMMLDLAGVSG